MTTWPDAASRFLVMSKPSDSASRPITSRPPALGRPVVVGVVPPAAGVFLLPPLLHPAATTARTTSSVSSTGRRWRTTSPGGVRRAPAPVWMVSMVPIGLGRVSGVGQAGDLLDEPGHERSRKIVAHARERQQTRAGHRRGSRPSAAHVDQRI